jgi:hypothetical protein
MSHESFEKSEVSAAQQSAAVLSADFANANHIQMRPVDQNLTVSADNKSLVFDTKALYGSGSQALPSSAEFDKLNTYSNRNPATDSLSRSEITKGAFDILIASNTNGNDRVDLNEWLNVAPLFGFDKAGAEKIYAEGVKQDKEGKSLYEITQNLVTPFVMSAADTSHNGSVDRKEFDNWVTDVAGNVKPYDNVPAPVPGPLDQPVDKPVDKPGITAAELERLHQQVGAYGSASIQDVAQIYAQIDTLPDAQKRELLRDNIQIELYGSSYEDPSAVPGAGAYTDGHKIVVYMNSGMSDEAFRHEVFHTFDLNSPNGGLVTNDATYQGLLQQELNNLTFDQFDAIRPILTDAPNIASKFGSTPIGDIAAEQYAGLTGDTSSFGRNLVNWLPNSSAYLKQLTEIA